MELPPRIFVLDVPIDAYTLEQTVDRTCEIIERKTFAHLIGINADKILQIRADSQLEEIVTNCEIINADGASMLLAAKLLNAPIPERVAGIDLMLALCQKAATDSLSVYLLGATNKVVSKTAQALEDSYPGIHISGFRDGYFDESEYDTVAEEVRRLDPDLIFVGITSPKKELLIEHFRSKHLLGAFVGVGGSFDVISGNIKRAPQWMQNLRLEWLFRMLQEPRRLGKRYIIGNTAFIRLLIREKLSFNRSNAR